MTNNKLKAALITAAIMIIPGAFVFLGLYHPHEALLFVAIIASAFVVWGVYGAVLSHLEYKF
jgi:VIT1/CCC1 family predicted Fe2+/Mn2+ transporter